MSGGFDKPRFLRVFTLGVYLFLFVPIFVVILFSFNSIKSLQAFDGFSLQWYEQFLDDPTLRESLFTSLEIAVPHDGRGDRARHRSSRSGSSARAPGGRRARTS